MQSSAEESVKEEALRPTVVYEYGQNWNVPAAPQKSEMAPKINPITNY